MTEKLENLFKISLGLGFVFSGIYLFWSEFFQEPHFLFKENSIKLNSEQIYSIELNENWVSLKELPPEAANILVDIEDKRFFSHKGYSLFDIHSALFHNFFLRKKLRGASTITQQLARTLFLNREKTIKRKLQEVQIAVALERTLSKSEILEFYLNTVYWGKGFNGIYYASRYHFKKPPQELNKEELVELIHKLKRPDAIRDEN
jgi:membrane peptidoglycan carboxypeptidase